MHISDDEENCTGDLHLICEIEKERGEIIIEMGRELESVKFLCNCPEQWGTLKQPFPRSEKELW